jgi:AraC-like DNA-binding protein
MEIMLSAAPHNHSDSLTECANRVAAWHVGRARDYIHEHLAEDMSITDIASEVGVTPRTLQSGFRKAFNLTPAEYIRRARVNALHQALLTAEETARVTTLMMSVGIVNFGRYAQYYREQLGVSPSPPCTVTHGSIIFRSRTALSQSGSHRRSRLTIVRLWTRGLPHRSNCKGTPHA